MRHFRFGEFVVSKTFPALAADIVLTDGHRDIIRLGVESVLDPLREDLGEPVYVSSGFRTRALNAAVGGKEDSDHLYACAADIACASPVWYVYTRAMLLQLPYRQIIMYHNQQQEDFIHISWNIPGRPYLHQALQPGGK